MNNSFDGKAYKRANARPKGHTSSAAKVAFRDIRNDKTMGTHIEINGKETYVTYVLTERILDPDLMSY